MTIMLSFTSLTFTFSSLLKPFVIAGIGYIAYAGNNGDCII